MPCGLTRSPIEMEAVNEPSTSPGGFLDALDQVDLSPAATRLAAASTVPSVSTNRTGASVSRAYEVPLAGNPWTSPAVVWTAREHTCSRPGA